MALKIFAKAIAHRLRQWAAGQNGNTVGAVLLVLSSLTVAVLLGVVRELGDTYSVWQIMLARAVGQLVFFIPFLARRRGAILKTSRLPLHVARIVMSFFAIACWFYSISQLPLAQASAFSFSKGVFVVALAGFFLGERPGIVGWGATLVGFCGILVMLDPSQAQLQIAGLVAVAGALIASVTTLVIKRLTQTESTTTLMAYSAVGLTVLCVAPALLTWQPITWSAAPLFLIAALSGSFTQWCFITAYRYGEASVMAIVEYLRLPAAAFVGFAVFAEIPTFASLIGMAMIIAASLISLRRKRIRAGIFS
ncbi:MAG: DMT family transporter [Alphaproteobacteria bacterium]